MTSWGACSVGCGGGTQQTTITCQSSDGTMASSDSLCTGANPSDSRSCNPEFCPPDPLGAEEPNFDSILIPHVNYNISWSGGILHSKIFFKIRTVETDTEPPGSWYDLTSQLGDVETLDELTSWMIPTSIVSGSYEMFMEAKNDYIAVNVTSDVFIIRNEVIYTVHSMLSPSTHSCAGCKLNAQLTGEYGDAVVQISSPSSTTITATTADFSSLYLGIVTFVNMTVVDSTSPSNTWGQTMSILINNIDDPTFFGDTTISTSQPSNFDVKANCLLQRDCFSCTLRDSCGWCASTEECMMLDASDQLSIGVCPGGTEKLVAELDQCPDPCTVSGSSCSACASTSGCSWCESSCACMAEGETCGTASDTTNPNVFVKTLATCQAIKAASTCASGETLTANAGADQVLAAGATSTTLDGSGSSVCERCVTNSCSGHGVCALEGLETSCECSSGYTGNDCSVPPNGCFGKDCSGKGVCVPDPATSIGYRCFW